jgi:hypothetical protein
MAWRKIIALGRVVVSHNGMTGFDSLRVGHAANRMTRSTEPHAKGAGLVKASIAIRFPNFGHGFDSHRPLHKSR